MYRLYINTIALNEMYLRGYISLSLSQTTKDTFAVSQSASNCTNLNSLIYFTYERTNNYNQLTDYDNQVSSVLLGFSMCCTTGGTGKDTVKTAHNSLSQMITCLHYVIARFYFKLTILSYMHAQYTFTSYYE